VYHLVNFSKMIKLEKRATENQSGIQLNQDVTIKRPERLLNQSGRFIDEAYFCVFNEHLI